MRFLERLDAEWTRGGGHNAGCFGSSASGGVAMNDRLFASDGSGSYASGPALVTMAAIAVYDRGPSAERRVRYEAQLAGYAVVRAEGASPWEAVRALLVTHRVLLARRWSPEGRGL